MFLTVVCVLGILGQLSNGLPYEDSSTAAGFKPLIVGRTAKDVETPRRHVPLISLEGLGIPYETPQADFNQIYDNFIMEDVETSEDHVPEKLDGFKKDPLEIQSAELNQLDKKIVGRPLPIEGSRVPLENPSADYTQFFDGRIVGGTEAPKGHSPHMVSLIVGVTWKSFVCGGSVISKKHVMTAAHCIVGFIQWDGDLSSSFHGRVGSNTWHKGIKIEFECYRIHPEYNHWLIKNDIGVLSTKGEIPLGKGVAIIALNYDWVDGGEKSYVTGWGTEQLWGHTPDKLNKLYVSTLSPKQCQKLAEKINAQWGESLPIDAATEICALHPEGAGYGMCHGDSGSAMVSKCSGKQIGIVSWGYPCAIGGPDVYVRVSAFKKFINSVLNGLFCHR